MLNQKIEMRLPDDTLLIAEATEKSDYPSINIYHQDASGDADEVVFAEYNPEKETGRKLMAAAYQNNDDDTRYKEVFWLRTFGELSFTQIGSLFDKTESWARVTYYRAKVMIKEEL